LFVCLEKPLTEIVAVYIAEKKLSARTSNVFIGGIQLEGEFNQNEKTLTELRVAGIIINNSIFFELDSTALVINY
jgi:hypothetical protein